MASPLSCGVLIHKPARFYSSCEFNCGHSCFGGTWQTSIPMAPSFGSKRVATTASMMMPPASAFSSVGRWGYRHTRMISMGIARSCLSALDDDVRNIAWSTWYYRQIKQPCYLAIYAGHPFDPRQHQINCCTQMVR